MHSDHDIKKSIRSYMMIGAALFVFTGITVAVNATIKGSMVASVFMHLSNEKKWIYGALILTLIGFVILMTVPGFTVMDGIGTPIHAPAAGAHGGH